MRKLNLLFIAVLMVIGTSAFANANSPCNLLKNSQNIHSVKTAFYPASMPKAAAQANNSRAYGHK